MSTQMKNKSLLSIEDFTEASIKIDDILRQIIIEHLVIDSSELYQLITKYENNIEQIAELKKVIDIGAFVKSKVETVMDTDYINRRISEMTHEFEDGLEIIKKDLLLTIEQNFDPSKADSYTNQINEFFEKKKREFIAEAKTVLDELVEGKNAITSKIDESFNPEMKSSYINQLIEFVQKFRDEIRKDFDMRQEGSISHQLKKMINQTIGQDGELLKTIENRFSFDNPQSVVTLLQENLLKKMDEIKAELIAGKSAEKAHQAAVEYSPQKGFQFEDLLMGKLEELAKQRGDVVENTTKQSGSVTQNKKGDFLYYISDLSKIIAIEAKNTKMTSLKDTLNKMDEIKANRKAEAVIWITASEDQLQKQVGSFQEYPDGNVITHFGLIEIALKIAISRLMIENSEIEGIDRVAVENEIINIKQSIKSFGSIKTAATNILTQADKIKAQVDNIKNDITGSLANLSELLLKEEQ